MAQVPGWNLVKENDSWKLHQSWKVKTFAKGMEFLRLVADVAEGEGILLKLSRLFGVVSYILKFLPYKCKWTSVGMPYVSTSQYT